MVKITIALAASGLFAFGASVAAPSASAATSTHHNPCARGQLNVYYTNFPNELDAGRVHNNGHGAKLRYTIVHQTKETLTFAPLSGYRVRLVEVRLFNLETNKVANAKKLSTSSRSYTNTASQSKSDVEVLDLCVSKG